MMKVELVDKMGNDVSVVNAARVSYSKESKTFTLKDEKLIKYLSLIHISEPTRPY